MTLAEKIKELSVKEKNELTGLKVKVNTVHVKNMSGNLRQFQSNGHVNIYLNDYYETNKNKRTKWVKCSPYNVEIVE